MVEPSIILGVCFGLLALAGYIYTKSLLPRKKWTVGPRAFYMAAEDINDHRLFPETGWYIEWRDEFFGPLTVEVCSMTLKVLKERRRQRHG